MNKIKERWDEIKEILRQEYEITNIRFSTWVAPLQLYKEDETISKTKLDSVGGCRIF